MLRIKVVVVLVFQRSAKFRFIIEDEVRNEHSLYIFVQQKAKTIYTAKSQSVLNLTLSFNCLSLFSSCVVQSVMQLNKMLIDLILFSPQHHEFAKRSLRYSLPHTINNAPDLLKDKVTTHSWHGFSNYIKLYYLNTYIEQCAIQNCYICQHDWLCLHSSLVKITLCISDCRNIIGICNIHTYLY